MLTEQKQKTIKKEIVLEGVGLHTGNKARVCLRPGPADSGISFVRVDLPQRPVIKADFSNILTDHKALPRCTSIGQENVAIHTVEHLMSVLSGCSIDNLIVEINNNELPGFDGSAFGFLKAIKEAGIVEQKARREHFEIKEPIWIERNGSAIFITPASDFKISYMLNYQQPIIHSEFFSTHVDANIFEKEIAPCRTFCLENEAEELKKSGLGKGANYENTLVLTKNGVKNNKVRFENEFARHKVLDFIGDLYLLGVPICGHVVAVKSGHTLNIALLKKIAEQRKKYEGKKFVPTYDFSKKTDIDIHGIMKILPHRYPFLFVDRILELDHGKRAVGIKNVTANDNFFQGHFPTKPIMPGVLMIEAMAQVGGIAALGDKEHQGKVALFMAANNVKFRKVVVPGDQMILEAQIVKCKQKTAQIHAQATVNGEIVAEADLIFSFTDSSFLN